jgi:hypothetical protein
MCWKRIEDELPNPGMKVLVEFDDGEKQYFEVEEEKGRILNELKFRQYSTSGNIPRNDVHCAKNERIKYWMEVPLNAFKPNFGTLLCMGSSPLSFTYKPLTQSRCY